MSLLYSGNMDSHSLIRDPSMLLNISELWIILLNILHSNWVKAMEKIPALLKSLGVVQFNGIHGEITKTFSNTAPLLSFAKIFKDGTLK